MAKCHTNVLHFVTFRDIWEPSARSSACHLPNVPLYRGSLQPGNRKISSNVQNSSHFRKRCYPFDSRESSRGASSLATAGWVCPHIRPFARHLVPLSPG